jgi:hypothetical protein
MHPRDSRTRQKWVAFSEELYQLLIHARNMGPVGEFRKICHPRNVEVYEIRVMSFQKHRTHEDLES